METALVGEELKPIDKSHVVALNQWVAGLMYITFQIIYDLKYLSVRISGYMN